MDTLAHGAWAYLIGRTARLPQRWLMLGLISAGPDFVWLPFTAFHFFFRGSITFFPLLYQLSHSLVLWLIVTALLSLRWKNSWSWSWPWALHILIDIPGHIAPSDQTPFLFPISNFSIRGWFDWLAPELLFINYFAIAIVYIFLQIRDTKKKFAKKT